MHTNPYIRAVICLIPLAFGGAAPLYPQSSGSTAFNVSVYDRTRVDSWQWFAAPPEANTYGYVESLLRVGIAQRLHRWDWQLELAQPSILAAPGDAISPVTAQGQLGLGASYYAANNNSNAASAFLKQGFARLNGEDSNLRLGRFEFIDGDPSHTRNDDRLKGQFAAYMHWQTTSKTKPGLLVRYERNPSGNKCHPSQYLLDELRRCVKDGITFSGLGGHDDAAVAACISSTASVRPCRS